MSDKLIIHAADNGMEMSLPYADAGVKAGFPSPAQDYMTDTLDLNKVLVRHPASTFYARVVGDSMNDFGISDGDLLIIDKAIEPQDDDIVVAFIDGDFTLKRFRRDPRRNCLWLIPGNPDYKPIQVTEEDQFVVWGVLTYNIKRQWNRR